MPTDYSERLRRARAIQRGESGEEQDQPSGSRAVAEFMRQQQAVPAPIQYEMEPSGPGGVRGAIGGALGAVADVREGVAGAGQRAAQAGALAPRDAGLEDLLDPRFAGERTLRGAQRPDVAEALTSRMEQHPVARRAPVLSYTQGFAQGVMDPQSTRDLRIDVSDNPVLAGTLGAVSALPGIGSAAQATFQGDPYEGTAFGTGRDIVRTLGELVAPVAGGAQAARAAQQGAQLGRVGRAASTAARHPVAFGAGMQAAQEVKQQGITDPVGSAGNVAAAAAGTRLGLRTDQAVYSARMRNESLGRAFGRAVGRESGAEAAASGIAVMANIPRELQKLFEGEELTEAELGNVRSELFSTGISFMAGVGTGYASGVGRARGENLARVEAEAEAMRGDGPEYRDPETGKLTGPGRELTVRREVREVSDPETGETRQSVRIVDAEGNQITRERYEQIMDERLREINDPARGDDETFVTRYDEAGPVAATLAHGLGLPPALRVGENGRPIIIEKNGRPHLQFDDPDTQRLYEAVKKEGQYAPLVALRGDEYVILPSYTREGGVVPERHQKAVDRVRKVAEEVVRSDARQRQQAAPTPDSPGAIAQRQGVELAGVDRIEAVMRDFYPQAEGNREAYSRLRQSIEKVVGQDRDVPTMQVSERNGKPVIEIQSVSRSQSKAIQAAIGRFVKDVPAVGEVRDVETGVTGKERAQAAVDEARIQAESEGRPFTQRDEDAIRSAVEGSGDVAPRVEGYEDPETGLYTLEISGLNRRATNRAAGAVDEAYSSVARTEEGEVEATVRRVPDEEADPDGDPGDGGPGPSPAPRPTPPDDGPPPAPEVIEPRAPEPEPAAPSPRSEGQQSPSDAPGITAWGRTHRVLVEGEPALQARYAIMPLSKVHASHDHATFSPNPMYSLRNTRDYHGSPALRDSVVRDAQNLEPDQLLSTAMSNQEGPPVVTPGGSVIGGNGRTMRLKRAWENDPASGAAYLDQLRQRAAEFGLDPADITPDSMLVRVVDVDVEGANLLVPKFNHPISHSESARELSNSVATLMTDRSLSFLSDISEDQTLRAALRDEGIRIFNELVEAGRIPRTKINEFVKGKELTVRGADVIEGGVVAKLVGDADLHAAMTKTELDLVGRAAAPLIRLRNAAERGLLPPEADLVPAFSRALENLKERGTRVGQGSLFGEPEGSPVVEEMTRLLQIGIGKRAKFGPVVREMAEEISIHKKATEGEQDFLGGIEPLDIPGVIRRTADKLEGKTPGLNPATVETVRQEVGERVFESAPPEAQRIMAEQVEARPDSPPTQYDNAPGIFKAVLAISDSPTPEGTRFVSARKLADELKVSKTEASQMIRFLQDVGAIGTKPVKFKGYEVNLTKLEEYMYGEVTPKRPPTAMQRKSVNLPDAEVDRAAVEAGFARVEVDPKLKVESAAESIRPDAQGRVPDPPADASTRPPKGALGIVLDPRVVRDLDSIKRTFIRWFASNSVRAGQDTQRSLEMRDGFVAAREMEMFKNINRLRNVVKTRYGADYSALPKSVRDTYSRYIQGQRAEVSDPEVREVLDLIRTNIDDLSRMARDLGYTPDGLAAVFDRNLGVYMKRSFHAFEDTEAWRAGITEDRFNRMVVMVMAENNRLTTEQAVSYVNRLIGDVMSRDGGARMTAGGQVKRNPDYIFSPRKDLDASLVKILGQIDDPLQNYIYSATRLANGIAELRFAEQLTTIGLRDGFLRPDPDAVSRWGDEPMDRLIYTTPDGREMWGSASMKQFFDDVVMPTAKEPGSFGNMFSVVNAMVKTTKTVYSPTTHVRNFVGTGMISFVRGDYNPRYARETARLAADLASGSPSDPMNLRLRELGVTGQAVHATEQVRNVREGLRGASNIAGNNPILKGLYNYASQTSAGRSIKSVHDVAVRFYGLEDDVFKISGFLHEMGRLSKKHPDLPKAELEEMAARRVLQELPVYSRVPRITDAIRKWPITGTFVAFPSEMVRVTANLFRNAVQDRDLAKIGRLFFMVGVGPMAATALSWAKTDFDQEKDAAYREFLPPWTEASQLLIMDYDGNGTVRHVDTSYTNPWSYFLNPTIQFAMGVYNEDEFGEVIWDTAQRTAEPFLGLEIITQTLAEISTNRGMTGGSIYDESASPFEQNLAKTTYLFEKAFAPGAWMQMQRVYNGYKGEITRSGQQLEGPQEMLNIMTGFRRETYDIRTAFGYKTREFSSNMSNARSMMTRNLTTRGTVSDEELRQGFFDAEAARERTIVELHRKVRAAQTLGVPLSELVSLMRQSQVSEQEISMVLSGQYIPYSPSRTIQEVMWNNISTSPGRSEESAREEYRRRLAVVSQLVRDSEVRPIEGIEPLIEMRQRN